MISIGSISLKNKSSVIEARNKIRAVMLELENNEVRATRIASCISEMARSVLESNPEGYLEVRLSKPSQLTFLEFSFLAEQRFSITSNQADFFNHISESSTEDGKFEFLAANLLTNDASKQPKLIDRLTSIVTQRGRDELMAELKFKNNELRESLENLKRTRTAKERMQTELNIGRDIQLSMVPDSFLPDRREFDAHAVLIPAREVGGDFYDVFSIDPAHVCLCVGDVSGKGVPSALFMAVTKTLIKSRAANDLSPASIISHVNSELSYNNESCMFVTVFLAVFDVNTGSMTYTNAGHNPPYIKHKSGNLTRLDNRHGPIVGAMEGIGYSESTTVLGPSDLIVIYTDGVTEAADKDYKLYSESRFSNLLSDITYENAADVIDKCIVDLEAFRGEEEPSDDITFLTMIYHGPEEFGVNVLELEISNELQEIARVIREFGVQASRWNLPKSDIQRLNLVFDELLNNIISYGFDDNDPHKIGIIIRWSQPDLAVEIQDDGKPFNPFGQYSPDTTLSVQDRPIGGLGIHLVQNVMDECAYRRRGPFNITTIKKTIKND